jgi:biopolymer transport protein ExbD
VRRKVRHDTEEAKVDLTPMLDIVFIMLIFFIVTATFVREAGLDVTKPDDNEEQQQNLTKSLRIVIDQNDRIIINMRDVDHRAVRAVVERYIAQNPKGAVVIQMDERSSTGTVVAVMDQSKLAGVTPSLAASADN